jgi:hypothetical protein
VTLVITTQDAEMLSVITHYASKLKSILLGVVMLYADCCYAESQYAECHYSESHYTESSNIECQYAECCLVMINSQCWV